MAKAKVPLLKPSLGVIGMSDADLLKRLNAVHDGMLNNPAYPNPPVDMAGYKAAIEAYTSAVSATLDGGKAATIARDKHRGDVIIMYRLLGHYVEGQCKNDPQTFTSSGFAPATIAPRAPAQPVDVPTIASVDHGSNSGQLLVTLKAVKKARSYDIRHGLVPAAGAAISWTTISVAGVRPPTPIDNLTPGGTYTFQVRAFGKLGFSDWSNPVNQMCT